MSEDDKDFEITGYFEHAVSAALEAGWSEERIREELDHVLASANEPEAA